MNLRKRKDEASEALAKGKLSKAAELFAALARQDPSDLQLRVRLGDVLRKLGRDGQAIAAYSEAADRFAEEGLTLRAIAVYKLVLEIDPNHAATQARLGALTEQRFNRTGPITPGPASRPTPGPSPVGRAPAGRPPALRNGAGAASGGMPPRAARPAIASGPGVDQPAASRPPPTLRPEAAPARPERTPGGSELHLDERRAEARFETSAPGFVSADDVIELVSVVPPAAGSLELELQPREPSAIEDLLLLDIDVEEEAAPIRSLAAQLPAIPLFSDMEHAALLRLLERCALVRLDPGEAAVRQGERGDSFFVVVRGRMHVVRAEPDGRRLELASLGEGAFFGEMALLTGTPRTASVIAREETELLCFEAAVLRALVAEHPSVAKALRRFYRQRLLTNVMATSPLFRGLERAARRALIERFTTREFTAGQVLIREGAIVDGLFVVLSGAVLVSKGEGARAVHIAEVREGEPLGEISLLTGSPATATCTARTRGMLLRLPAAEFRSAIETHPPLRQLIARLGDERQRSNQARLASLPPDEELSLV